MSNDLGLDRSGNGNNWTVNNLAYSDQMVDSPTNNFATMNPLDSDVTSVAEGNLSVTTDASNNGSIKGTMAFPAGKWYYEVVLKSYGGSPHPFHWGIGKQNAGITTWLASGEYAVMEDNGALKIDGSTTTYSSVGFEPPDVVGIAVNVDDNQITFYKNNVSLGAYNYTIEVNEYRAYIGDGSSVRSGTTIVNFGQDSSFAGYKTAQGNQDGNDIGDFYYTPPTGFLALCTSNLPAVAVVPSEHFNTVLWTGTTSVDRDITGIGFDPSLVWIKSRSDAYEQLWFDKVRGAGERLMSHNTNAESTNDSTLNAFITDGFTLGNGSTVDLSVNGNTSKTYVAWNWKAATTYTPTVTSGLTSASGRSNADAGFSIVKVTADASIDNNSSYTHNLGVAPEMIITKITNSTGGWNTYHKDLGGAGKYIELNTTTAVQDATNVFETTPTSTIVKPCSNIIANGQTLVFYNFASVDGYSKVGSYEGNANADGTFVYTGFRPAMVIIKEADNANDWHLIDNKREAELGNPVQAWLRPNTVNIEASSDNDIDLLSNGFKARTSSNRTNRAATLIYIAFAETPFKYSNAR